MPVATVYASQTFIQPDNKRTNQPTNGPTNQLTNFSTNQHNTIQQQEERTGNPQLTKQQHNKRQPTNSKTINPTKQSSNQPTTNRLPAHKYASCSCYKMSLLRAFWGQDSGYQQNDVFMYVEMMCAGALLYRMVCARERSGHTWTVILISVITRCLWPRVSTSACQYKHWLYRSKQKF